MPTTLRHVADHLQLSPALVSRVLNHAPGKWASEETQKRVFAAAQELNYRPSAAAAALRTGKTRQLAVVSVGGDSSGDQFLDLEGIVAGAGEEGYRVVVLPLQSGPDAEREFGEFLANRACDGLCLFAPQVTQAHLSLVARYKIPCVVIGSLNNPDLARMAVEHAAIVDHDNYRAVHDSVLWLYAQGKRRMVWPKIWSEAEQSHVRALQSGYRDAMQSLDLEPVFLEFFKNQSGLRDFLKSTRADAAIVRYLPGAMGWLMTAHEAGLKLPQDFTILAHMDAHDANNLMLYGVNEKLALHLYDVREVGYCAAQILLRWAGGQPPIKRTILVEAHPPSWGAETLPHQIQPHQY